jgi:hypothetical protein
MRLKIAPGLPSVRKVLPLILIALAISLARPALSQGQFNLGDFFAAHGQYRINELRQKNQELREAILRNRPLLGAINFQLYETELRLSLDTLMSHFAESEFKVLLADLARAGTNQQRQTVDNLKALSLAMHNSLLDEIYVPERQTANAPRIVRQLFREYARDLVLFSALMIHGGDSYAPALKQMYEHADRYAVMDTTTPFLNSLKEILNLEYPNFHGAANLIAAEWVNQSFLKSPTENDHRADLGQACMAYAEHALNNVDSDYAKSIASFLLAAYHGLDSTSLQSLDIAWSYYKQCLEYEIDYDSLLEASPYFAYAYYGQNYFVVALNLLNTYFGKLAAARRYYEFINIGDYLLAHEEAVGKYRTDIAQRVYAWGQTARLELLKGDKNHPPDPDAALVIENALKRFEPLARQAAEPKKP